jgi:two-component system cell cycle response regulator CpdR
MAKILLAEDDASMRLFIQRALEKAGHEVSCEADGLTALSHLEKGEQYDLLLTDIVMPGIDGIELSQKAMNLQPELKVMFITGFAAVAMDAGKASSPDKAAKVLAKPFHLNDLVTQVETLLRAA